MHYFLPLLLVALIVLKLTGHIALSWWWIALIGLGPVAVVLILAGVFLLAAEAYR